MQPQSYAKCNSSKIPIFTRGVKIINSCIIRSVAPFKKQPLQNCMQMIAQWIQSSAELSYAELSTEHSTKLSAELKA